MVLTYRCITVVLCLIFFVLSICLNMRLSPGLEMVIPRMLLASWNQKALNGTSYKNMKMKPILFYNSFYMWKDFTFGLGTEPFRTKCGRSDCRTTLNHSEFDNADVVVFYGQLFRSQVPKRGHNQQLFLYLNTEPPAQAAGRSKCFGLDINLTISYRHDSSIQWPYGLTMLKEKDDLPYVPLNASQLASKTIPVAWMVSRCKPASIRGEYVNELRKYIRVDIYGKCGNYTCSKQKKAYCMKLLEKQYKFYLSFENSICEDYITEKTFRTLQYNLVPVVMGGGNYKRDLPSHSFIDPRDFSSPKQLAEYLHHLDRTPKEYLKYFEWKHTHKIHRVMCNGSIPFCRLCEALHDESTQYYSNFDVHEWWEGNHCIWTRENMSAVYHVYD